MPGVLFCNRFAGEEPVHRSGKEEKNAIYAEMAEKVRKRYQPTKIYDSKMAGNSIIMPEQMQERYLPAKELLQQV